MSALDSSSDVYIDSLPYVDGEISPEYQAYVDQLIVEEVKRGPAITTSALPVSVELFKNNPILQAELARVSRGEKLSALDLSRLRLEPPTASSPNTQPTSADWERAIQNSQSQLEHQWNRLINLELMNKFGSNAWRLHNYQMDHAVAGVKKVADSNKEEIMSVNKQRKSEQIKAGNALSGMELRRGELLGRVLQVDLASASLEAELERLRAEKARLESAV
ncbi:hypothetical protein HK097_011329 [Rhizophlyctis rosea]|uniref:Pre-mRNA-splicing factor SPF27 n=1 Tax=Rhizophlyctis rosea TaxID=64517 RepID=A0AAD5X3U0_9FUNG|nr:hypothetical protein HK097_011329 [Rhizophlyctis rosea]